MPVKYPFSVSEVASTVGVARSVVRRFLIGDPIKPQSAEAILVVLTAMGIETIRPPWLDAPPPGPDVQLRGKRANRPRRPRRVSPLDLAYGREVAELLAAGVYPPGYEHLKPTHATSIPPTSPAPRLLPFQQKVADEYRDSKGLVRII